MPLGITRHIAFCAQSVVFQRVVFFLSPRSIVRGCCYLITVTPDGVPGTCGHLSATLCTLRCRANSKGSPTHHPFFFLSARPSLSLAAPCTLIFAALGRQISKSRVNSVGGLIVDSFFSFKARPSRFNAKTRTF